MAKGSLNNSMLGRKEETMSQRNGTIMIISTSHKKAFIATQPAVNFRFIAQVTPLSAVG